jgi:hypothetical protein
MFYVVSQRIPINNPGKLLYVILTLYDIGEAVRFEQFLFSIDEL